jgi:hypothetical protein
VLGLFSWFTFTINWRGANAGTTETEGERTDADRRLPSLAEQTSGGDMGLYFEGCLKGFGRTGCSGRDCSAAKYCEFQLPAYRICKPTTPKKAWRAGLVVT